MASGATPTIVEVSKYYADKETGVPFIRVQNLNETGLLSLDDLKYINQETHENYLKRSQVHEDDLLVKITGVGRMAVAGVPPKGFEGNINQHSVVVKTESRETSEVLAAYLNSEVGEKLASRRATGGTRPALDYPALKSIPIIYDIRILELAKRARKERELKYSEAEEIIKGIDKYLLNELEIFYKTEVKNIANTEIFKLKSVALSATRFDPLYHSPFFERFFLSLNMSKYNIKSLKSVSRIIFQGVGKNETLNDAFTLLKVKNILKNNQIDFKNVEYVGSVPTNKVLIDKDIITPFIGEAVRQIKFSVFSNAEKKYTVDNNTGVIRLNKDLADPDYVANFLNSLLGAIQIKKLTAGGGVPFLGTFNAKHLMIVLPDMTTQKKIALHINKIREGAMNLRTKADDDFNQAKKEIENLILG